METRSLALPAPVAHIVIPLLLTGTAILTAYVICAHQSSVPSMFALALIVLLLALSRLRTASLVIVFIISDHLCQFLKRAIFLIGEQQKWSYYGFQMLPTMVLAVTVVSSYWVLRKVKFSSAANALAIYLAISLTATLASPGGGNLAARFGGVNQAVLPICMFFAGMAVPITAWPRIAKLFLVLIVISVPFGVYQYITGPTQMDIAWAEATHIYSVQGWKVWAYLHQGYEFRGYSYYSDHVLWGHFLVNAAFFIAACTSMKVVPKDWRSWAMFLTPIGMVVTGTRAVWLEFVGALVIYKLLSMRKFRRPLLMVNVIIASLVLVIWLGTYMRSHLHFTASTSALVNRYLTVGTISARVSAFPIFLRELPKHLFYGNGFGSGYLSANLDENLKGTFTKDQYSHNLAVDLLISVGLPGLMAFIVFVYLWIKEAFWLVSVSEPREARAIRWLIALFVGMLLSSGIATGTFLTDYFFLISGLVAGEWSRKKLAYEAIPRHIPIARNRRHAMAVPSLSPTR